MTANKDKVIQVATCCLQTSTGTIAPGGNVSKVPATERKELEKLGVIKKMIVDADNVVIDNNNNPSEQSED